VLSKAKITQLYPNLIHDLTHCSPIGNPPLLQYMFIPNNLPSANIQLQYITYSIMTEVAAGCMDGPFTIDQVHTIYGSHFRMCPLGLIEKHGSMALCMICHFLKEDHLGISMNSWVNWMTSLHNGYCGSDG